MFFSEEGEGYPNEAIVTPTAETGPLRQPENGSMRTHAHVHCISLQVLQVAGHLHHPVVWGIVVVISRPSRPAYDTLSDFYFGYLYMCAYMHTSLQPFKPRPAPVNGKSTRSRCRNPHSPVWVPWLHTISIILLSQPAFAGY